MCWNTASGGCRGKAGCNGDWLNLSVPLKLSSAPSTSGSRKGWGCTVFLRSWGVLLMALGRVCCELLAGGRERQIEQPRLDPPP
jgi:hypothetical protein